MVAQTQNNRYCFKACPPGEFCQCRNLSKLGLNVEEELIKILTRELNMERKVQGVEIADAIRALRELLVVEYNDGKRDGWNLEWNEAEVKMIKDKIKELVDKI